VAGPDVAAADSIIGIVPTPATVADLQVTNVDVCSVLTPGRQEIQASDRRSAWRANSHERLSNR
jgi:hypothetical protein